MKRNILLITMILAFTTTSNSQTSITESVFQESVENKVENMQQLIGFDNQTAQQIREIELIFLLEVNKAEHCLLCRKQKRIEKLKKSRDEQLQKILPRDQYIKYDAIDNERIKKQPLWAK
jgi:glutathione peroxidase-family protein